MREGRMWGERWHRGGGCGGAMEKAPRSAWTRQIMKTSKMRVTLNRMGTVRINDVPQNDFNCAAMRFCGRGPCATHEGGGSARNIVSNGCATYSAEAITMACVRYHNDNVMFIFLHCLSRSLSSFHWCSHGHGASAPQCRMMRRMRRMRSQGGNGKMRKDAERNGETIGIMD